MDSIYYDDDDMVVGISESFANFAPNELLLSDDIWNKFDWPLEDVLNSFEDFGNLDRECSTLSSLKNNSEECEIRNHDCMWAGHCGSKEHPVDEPRAHSFKFIPTVANNNSSNNSALLTTTTSALTMINKNSAYSNPTGRSLLLKTQIKQQQQQQMLQQQQNAESIIPVLDSPPNSDDEEAKAKTVTLQLLQDAISECDSDLYDYFEDTDLLQVMDEQPKPKETPAPVPTQFTSDHCYHKDKNASMRMSSLGIETPSDSEEEIDVVSVGDHKQTVASSRMACVLPNNPTIRDKHQIQRTMASAMTKSGIKTMLPRKSAAGSADQGSSQLHQQQQQQQHRHYQQQQQQAKRRAMESTRGIKRAKHRSPPSSPYKKRSSYNHSSDSEPEPSEKRNLHNNMERQRRIDLRNAFEDLRVLVPEVSKRERAPKVVILREAASYCDQLGDISDSMNRDIDDLRRQQRFLRSRVSQLRLSLASKHR